MTAIRKILIPFSLALSILSCSKSDITTPNDNLDFIVLSRDEGDYSSLYQLSVFESGEVIETDLVSEFGGLESLSSIPRPYRVEGELFLHMDRGLLHIKNLRENWSTSIKTLCGASLDNSTYRVITTENKILLSIKSFDGKTKDFLTIDKNLEQSSCKRISYSKSPFHSSAKFQYSSSKYVLFDRTHLANDNWSYKTFLFTYNTESNQLDSISIDKLTDVKSSLPIVMDKDKFYIFSNNKTYKIFSFEFNLLEEGTCDEYFSPIEGSHIVENKMKVEIFHPTTTGFYTTKNVYDIHQRKFLIDEMLLVEKPVITPNTGQILTSEYDLKRERIILGVSTTESGYKILITDFNNNILNEIPINSFPMRISIL
ncbi:MAG: hypothetical protein AAGU19_20480 [Prolixibacteraceae bacterium]